ncbi:MULTISPECIES: DUF6680 family protein [Erythrobacter]|uniref:DUF6680 domain-containing protein n=1 Tax=Erythrobacter mangrovi TaxID=2739433 RepID=A0A7D3X9L5_9SPHN|nr:DUF6680 family protein [Erythrobacter mangrovi]QKG71155.1 hypothetical protein HQR01_07045 [Erythrobacter mangrovi]
MSQAPDYYDWLVLAAIFCGPLVGIWVTRLIDASKEQKNRRWELFVTLRRTRGLELSPDHVAAVNMVPVLFSHDKEAMEEWGKLMDSLNDPSWNSADDNVRLGLITRSGDARHNLIRRIGEVVGARLPIREEHRLGYAPVAWVNEMNEQAEVRQRFIEVLRGERSLHMVAGVFDLANEVERKEVLAEDNGYGALPTLKVEKDAAPLTKKAGPRKKKSDPTGG